MVSRFDGQGAIRSMFETRSFDENTFINNFFPTDPPIDKCKDQYLDEIEKYIEVLRNKYELHKSKEKVDCITIQNITESSNTLKLKNITNVTRNNLKSNINKIRKEVIVELDAAIKKLENVCSSRFFEAEDKASINPLIHVYYDLVTKYNNKVAEMEREIRIFDIINSIFNDKNSEFSRTRTDETERIMNYEDEKNKFEDSIVDYYLKNKNILSYAPHVTENKIPVTTTEVGKYRFVAKTDVKVISNDDILYTIRSVLGKGVSDINDINEDNLPAKFSKGANEQSYYEKLDVLKDDLYSCVEKRFKVEHIINDASDDKDITVELSAGFNSKIYFDLISNQTVEYGLYIIYLPEDVVSQPSIRKSLLDDFYNMSRNRQIILITHNPQFIINLDVDNVIFIGKDDDGRIYIRNGALEYYDEEDKDYDILKIVADNIEGGVESINERWKRYEKNIYNVSCK